MKGKMKKITTKKSIKSNYNQPKVVIKKKKKFKLIFQWSRKNSLIVLLIFLSYLVELKAI